MSTKAESKPKLKVVVRSLPYCFTDEDFKTLIASFLADIDFYYYIQGKKQKKERDSIAYVHFNDPANVLKFHQTFAGHTFVDPKGKEYRCTIEYAPYQKIPRKQAPRDARQGTFEDDIDFQRFIEQTSKPPEFLPSAEVQYEERKKKEETEKPKSTPILEELKAKAQNHLKQKHRAAATKRQPKNPRKPKPKGAAPGTRPSVTSGTSDRTNTSTSAPERSANSATPSSVSTQNQPRASASNGYSRSSRGSDHSVDKDEDSQNGYNTTNGTSVSPGGHVPTSGGAASGVRPAQGSQKPASSAAIPTTNGSTNRGGRSGGRPPARGGSRGPSGRGGGRGGRTKGTWKERDPSSPSGAPTGSSTAKTDHLVTKIQVRDGAK